MGAGKLQRAEQTVSAEIWMLKKLKKVCGVQRDKVCACRQED